MTVVKKISGIPAAAYNEMTDEQKINQAVKILMKREKNIADLLVKLAELSEKKPFIFKMAVAKLNSL